MRRSLVCTTLLLAFATVGCRPESGPASVTTVYGHGFTKIGGEPYPIEIESADGASMSSTLQFKVENKVARGFAEVTCGSHKMRIDDDRLTFDGADRGRLKIGDRIKVTSAGKLFINETEVIK